MDSSQGGKLPSSKSNMSYLGSFGLQRAMFVLARGARARWRMSFDEEELPFCSCLACLSLPCQPSFLPPTNRLTASSMGPLLKRPISWITDCLGRLFLRQRKVRGHSLTLEDNGLRLRQCGRGPTDRTRTVSNNGVLKSSG